MAWWIAEGVLTRADAAPAENSVKTDMTGKGKVVIPEGVTGIGDAAFRDCRQLEQVVFSDDVVSVGDEAFAGCKALSYPKA